MRYDSPEHKAEDHHLFIEASKNVPLKVPVPHACQGNQGGNGYDRSLALNERGGMVEASLTK